MGEENISQEVRLEHIDETRTYFIDRVNYSQVRSKKYKKVCTVLIYIESLLISTSAVTGFVLIFAFPSLLVFL